MWNKGVWVGLITACLAWLLGITALDAWLLSRLSYVSEPRSLQTAVALLCLIPFTLAGWAVPLAVAYRLRYDRRHPAGLPSWRRGTQTGLLIGYRSAFWRGYAALFAWSIFLVPVHLLVFSWWMVGLHLLVLAGLTVRAGWRQWRKNGRDQTVIDEQRRTICLPPLGDLAFSEAHFGVEPELVVSPRSDTTYFWVTVSGTRWHRFALREHAEEVAVWLRERTTV